MSFLDRAKVTTATTGTGPLALGKAVVKFQSFRAAGAVDGKRYRYVVEEGKDWEISSGIYTADGEIISREFEKSSTGAPLNLSGKAIVYAPVTAADLEAMILLGTEDALPKFGASGVVQSDISNVENRVGINKVVPGYVLDVAAKPAADVQLTGSFSYSDSILSGVGTLMMSELAEGAVIKVASTGQNYTIDYIASDFEAYIFSGGAPFNDEVCTTSTPESNYFNLLEMLKSYYLYGNTVRENNEHSVYNRAERIYNQSAGSIQEETNLATNGTYSHAFRVAGKLAALLYIVQENGLLGMAMRDLQGKGITYWSNNTITVTGLPTSSAGLKPNTIWRDANGFLRIV